MNKLILLFMLLFISACSSSVEVAGENFDSKLCINGHLYYATGYSIVPLFDYRTDTPVLIQCKKTNGVIEYEREKVK